MYDLDRTKTKEKKKEKANKNEKYKIQKRLRPFFSVSDIMNYYCTKREFMCIGFLSFF